MQHKRDEVGYSPKGLAKECNLPLSLIEDIESGKELFLPVTVRQNLAKVLKCDPHEIKELEKDYTSYTVSQEIIDSLKELILNGAGGLKCPKCGEGTIVERKSKRGTVFYGCDKYPNCDFTLWNEPTGEKCPECGSLLVKKTMKKGDVIACSNIKCGYKKECEQPENAGE